MRYSFVATALFAAAHALPAIPTSGVPSHEESGHSSLTKKSQESRLPQLEPSGKQDCLLNDESCLGTELYCVNYLNTGYDSEDACREARGLPPTQETAGSAGGLSGQPGQQQNAAPGGTVPSSSTSQVNQNEENDQSSSSQSPSSNGQNEAQSDQSTSNLGSSDLGSKPAVAESTSNNNPQTLDSDKQSAPVSSQSNNGLGNAWNPGSGNAWHSSGQPVTGDNQNNDASVSNVQLAQPSAPESNSKVFQPSTEEQSGLNMLTPDTQNGFNDLSGSNSVQSAQAPSNGQDDARSGQPGAAESVGEGKPYDEQAYKNIVNAENSAYDQMRQNWNNGKYIPGVDGFNDNNNPIFGDRGNYDAAVSESQSYDPSTEDQ